jgi:hypothetical protein
MEIILNILLFSVLLVAGLQFFMHTRTLTEKTQELHQAVAECESVAAVFESGNGTLDDLIKTYRYCVNLNPQLLIYLDENFNECPKKDASYYISVVLDSDTDTALSKLTITCYRDPTAPLYTLTACHYTQLQALLESHKSVNGREVL